MKFSVLAIDFDGTIAQNDQVDPVARQAIADLRAKGITIILVTGRILAELRRIAGDLHFVDAIVGENGAVIEFPDSGYTRALGPPPSPELVNMLRQDGLDIVVGKVIIDARADDAPRILATIRRLELPLMLAFNRGRVMIVPQAISKATGIREAMAMLRLSSHNAVAIGDAENDHELLRVCEVGVAVNWGSPALKKAADHVVPGNGPADLGPYLSSLAGTRLVPAPRQTRRHLLLGYTMDGHALELAVRGRTVLVAGDPKSGKSWVTGLLCEQLILYGYSLCILDPEGDYASLQALPGVTVLGGADPLPRPRELARALRHADTSLVIDFSHVSFEEKRQYIRTVLPALAVLRRETGLPHRIVLDEAHYFLSGADASHLIDLDYGGYTLTSYRASGIHSNVLGSAEVIVVTRESDPADARMLRALCRRCKEERTDKDWITTFTGLTIGEAAVLPVTDEAHGDMRRIILAPRLTPHVRHQTKYVDIPVVEHRAFVFTQNGTGTPRRVRTLKDFVKALDEIDAATLDGYLRRSDFSRWIIEVFGDYPLARGVRRLENEYRAGIRPDVVLGIAQAVRSRYDFPMPLQAESGPERPVESAPEPPLATSVTQAP
jgi:hydroxymethylpyrimidine pyrophosphatase-like HAD family hydrolase